MTRILLFLATNAAVLVLISVVFQVLGIEGILAENGVDLNLQALLLMSAGSVLLMTGKRKCTDLGGLFQSMPVTAINGIIGALAISAFPFTSGFVTKSLETQAAANEGMLMVDTAAGIDRMPMEADHEHGDGPLDPHISFGDDPLRMLRFFRFVSQLGFAPDEFEASLGLNLNVLVLNPLWLWLGLRPGRGLRALPVVAGFSALALLLAFLPAHQYTLDVLAAFLPLNLAAGAALDAGVARRAPGLRP